MKIYLIKSSDFFLFFFLVLFLKLRLFIQLMKNNENLWHHMKISQMKK